MVSSPRAPFDRGRAEETGVDIIQTPDPTHLWKEKALYMLRRTPPVSTRVCQALFTHTSHANPVHSTAIYSYVPRYSCYMLLRPTVLLSAFTFHPAAVCLYVPHYSCCLLLSTAIVCSHASPAGCLRGGESRPGSPGPGGGDLRRGDLARSGGWGLFYLFHAFQAKNDKR